MEFLSNQIIIKTSYFMFHTS